MKKFRETIRFIVAVFASREMGFIYTVLGTITQIAHTYYLANEISSFTGGFKIFQAVLLSTFISSSLLFFVAIADNSDDSKEARNIKWTINVFVFIEILINVYYYSRSLIIDSSQMQVFDFIFAVIISALLPITIKMYGGLIRAKSWINEIDEKNNQKETGIIPSDHPIINQIRKELNDFLETFEHFKSDIDTNIISTVEGLTKTNLEEIISDKTNVNVKELMEEYKKTLDADIAKIFAKNQELFLVQFENKLKMMKNQNV